MTPTADLSILSLITKATVVVQFVMATAPARIVSPEPLAVAGALSTKEFEPKAFEV
mgnify:CR=1 FL=1